MPFPFNSPYVESYRFANRTAVEIGEALQGAIGALGWSLEEVDDLFVLATVPASFRSWGENVRVEIDTSGMVTISSKSIDLLSLLDMGKNKSNVKRLIAKLEAYLEVTAEIVDPTKPSRSRAVLTFQYPFIRVHGRDAIRTLMQLRAKGGCVPVILGSPEQFDGVKETMALNDAHSVQELIDLSRTIDAEPWFRAHAEPESKAKPNSVVDWPSQGDIPKTELTSHCDTASGLPLDEVIVAEIPAAMPWRVPCYLRIGSWNAVPPAEVHAALFKYWGDRFQANVACITHDVIELTVDRPPTTREEALELARQHYSYCPDIVDQGTGTVELLAATLLDSKVWYFWWD